MYKLYHLTCGHVSAWFTSRDTAMTAARALFDSEVDGIPFVTECAVENEQDMISLLNMESARSNREVLR